MNNENLLTRQAAFGQMIDMTGNFWK